MRLLSFLSLCICAIVLVQSENTLTETKSRARRAIAFKKGSSFFYRLNYKIGSIPSSTIFAQATGFKVTWKLPYTGMEERKRRNVDEIHESAELLYESHGFNGKACFSKNICQIKRYIKGKEGVVAKIVKLLTDRKNDNSTISKYDEKSCQKYSILCPLELLEINRVTNNIN